jgi:hypothetical protein
MKPQETKALFIPTAAINVGAIGVLPKCMNDLLKCGIREENITVYDLHQIISTYNTDYILTKVENYIKALKILSEAGYQVH